nr:YbaB/EbfC family nucleoid-associated protein [Kibdelosporangium sp. MJ126-NF4]
MEQLVAEFEKFKARIQQAEVKFSGVGDMQDQLAQLEVVATSQDRTVRVVAGAGGTVTDIQLTPDAMRQPAPALAATIMSTLREAVADAARRQAGIVDETVAGAFGISVSDQVQRAQEEAQGTAVEEPASQHSEQTAPPRRPRPSEDDGEPGQDTIFRQPRY